MDYCEHCGDIIPNLGSTLVLCRCEGAWQAELEDTQRHKAWQAARTAALDKQRDLRRSQRRRRNRNKQKDV